MAHADAPYWDRGVADVERMTGLGRAPSPAILDGADIREVCRRLDIPVPVLSLLDVGCGTGRVSALAESYLGVDISASAVQYCHSKGRPSFVIDGPETLAVLCSDTFSWVWACSVFTHISRDEQQRYLRQFVRLAPRILVDILPGDPGQSPARWGTDESGFLVDLAVAGWTVSPVTWDVVDGSSPTAPRHRYFTAVRT